MIMKIAQFIKALSGDLVAAASLTLATLAVLTLATMAAVSAHSPLSSASPETLVALTVDDLQGGGQPPSPGPTDPNSPR